MDTSDIPFSRFEGYLFSKLPELTARLDLGTSPADALPVPEKVEIWKPEREVLEALDIIVPDQYRLDRFLIDHFMSFETQIFESSIHRSLLFSVANNFASFRECLKESVFQFLRHETKDFLYRMTSSASVYYTTQAIAINLFRHSIEIGDEKTVKFLIEKSPPGIQVDQIVCSHRGTKYTPIQKAAMLLHTNVVKVLLLHGADPTPRHPGSMFHDYNALDCAVLGVRGVWWFAHRATQPYIDLFSMLADADCELNEHLRDSIIKKETGGHLVRLMISRDIVNMHEKWSEEGVFHRIFKYQSDETSLAILEKMLYCGADLNAEVQESHNGTWPKTIIDVVAERGHSVVIERLLEVGAIMTGDTLPCAILSGNESLVRDLLHLGANIDQMGSLGISPLAAAIGRRNPARSALIDLVCEHQRMNSLADYSNFHSALKAAMEVGDAEWCIRLRDFGIVGPKDLGSALLIAARDGRGNAALALIDAGADTNVSSHSKADGTPLYQALKSKDAALVCALLEADADPNYRHPRDSLSDICPAIELAIKWGDADIVRRVIEADTDVNICCKCFESRPALSRAIQQKDMGRFAMLLRAGCDINNPQARWTTHTALRAAVESDELRIVRLVLEHGADPHDPHALVAASKKDERIFKLLLQWHAARYPKGRKGWGEVILKNSIDLHNLHFFQRMIDSGADANSYCGDGLTLFGYAIAMSKLGRIEFVRLLLQSKQKTECAPETIVSRVYSEGYGEGPDYRPIARLTAFLAAIGAEDIPTIKLLLQHGADVNFPAERGIKRTPLQRAAEMGSMDVVRILLRHRADVNAPAAQRGGGTALHLAAIGGYIPIMSLLAELGADLNAPASKFDGRTALEGAAEHGRLDTVAILLQAGAAHGGEDWEELNRAIAFATGNGHTHIAHLLTEFRSSGMILNGTMSWDERMDWDGMMGWDEMEE